MRRPPVKVSWIPIGLVAAVCAWIYYPTFTVPGPPLVFKVEGALDSKLNFRDAGTSINQCAGQTILKEGLLFRSSGFFSGWSCDRVGNPDVIYSLNVSDAENRRYYCRGSDGYKIGTYFQRDELSDIEFIANWDRNREQVKQVCAFLRDGINQFDGGHKSLFHCEAGRDRTGAVIALIAAWELEADGNLSDAEIAAIECDYRKSKSLRADKYGRVDTFLRSIRDRGGIKVFLRSKCGW